VVVEIVVGGGEMTVVRVPSETVEGIPAFECELPDGWSAREAAGVLVSFGSDDDHAVSVLVSSVRIDRSLDLRAVAVRSLAQQRRVHPDLRLDSQRIGRFGDRLTYLRAVTLPGDDALGQLHALFLAPGAEDRPVSDAFSVVATGPASRIDDLGPVFVDLVASFRFTEAVA
jgi:hypothetical protein